MAKSFLTKGYYVGGVYMIRNVKNKKMLIGTTFDFEEHRKQVYLLLKNGKHSNRFLQEDFNKGGRFQYRVLYAEQHQRPRYSSRTWIPMIEKAREFIEQYDAINCGYNFPIGYARRNYKGPKKSMVE